MRPRRLFSFLLASSFLAFAGLGLFASSPASALPPTGTDVLGVAGQVAIVSRLGQETVPLYGTVTILREPAHMEGGIGVVDFQVTDIQLNGQSLIGQIDVTENAGLPSFGELRSLQTGSKYPASSYIDAFVNVSVPANPTATLTLHNNQALRLVPTSGGAEVSLNEWPPTGVTFALVPIFNVDNDGDTLIDEDTADDDGDRLIDEDRPGADPDTPGSGSECGTNPDCDALQGEDPPANLCPAASPGNPTLCDDDADGLIDEDPACIPLLNTGNTHLPAGICVRTISIAPLGEDTDGDGCADLRELGMNEELGGRRDPLNPWDFYDTNGDRVVDLFIDIFGVAMIFGADADALPPGEPDGYDPVFDRSDPPQGADLWDMGPPNGLIDLGTDIFGAAFQFGHSCA